MSTPSAETTCSSDEVEEGWDVGVVGGDDGITEAAPAGAPSFIAGMDAAGEVTAAGEGGEDGGAPEDGTAEARDDENDNGDFAGAATTEARSTDEYDPFSDNNWPRSLITIKEFLLTVVDHMEVLKVRSAGDYRSCAAAAVL